MVPTTTTCAPTSPRCVALSATCPAMDPSPCCAAPSRTLPPSNAAASATTHERRMLTVFMSPDPRVESVSYVPNRRVDDRHEPLSPLGHPWRGMGGRAYELPRQRRPWSPWRLHRPASEARGSLRTSEARRIRCSPNQGAPRRKDCGGWSAPGCCERPTSMAPDGTTGEQDARPRRRGCGRRTAPTPLCSRCAVVSNNADWATSARGVRRFRPDTTLTNAAIPAGARERSLDAASAARDN